MRAGCPGTSYWGGPDERFTEAVCDCPDESVHPTVTLSPGWNGTSRLVSALGEATVWPLSEVMVSPSASPPSCAGELVMTEQINAPEDEELPEPDPDPVPDPKLPPKLPPKPEPKPESPLPLLHEPCATSTPRNAVAPMWTVEEAVPASICLAIVIASLIGMA